ncbi:MAG: single-stranded-DNA-specific exonuclease RecJ [Ruthenibacterium sp.]
MFYRPWQINRPDKIKAAKLAAESGLARLACEVLLARGKNTAAEIKAVTGEGQMLSDPMSLCNMPQAVELILQAVDSGKRIVVFGDYDVDGVTATALLYLYLDSVGADVYYKLPSREDEGYGLSKSAVSLMAGKGVNLIITVDNGVSANEAIAFANEKGIDVVVTDHHLPPQILPDAAAIVDPQLPDDTSGCKTLCGAGVAFYLIAALEGCAAEEMLPFYGDLAAIGTIGDIMLLEGENRTIVKAGLALLQHTERPGLAALVESCGFSGKEITAENVSFGISPRLNAAGRMDSATAALELLLCEDADEAATRVAALEEQNVARQKAEQDITQNVLDTIAGDAAYGSERILVVAGEGYHQGVIGIVASRVMEKFGKPTLIISIDENGEGKGSGRSLAGVSLYQALASCSDLLIRYGGHALAAGLSIARENIPAFRKAINLWAEQAHPMLRRPALKLDTSVSLAEIDEAAVSALCVLAPFGNGNPAPLFLLENAVIEGIYAVSEGKHSRLRLRQGKATLYAVLFGIGPDALCYAQGDVVDVALSLSVYDGKNGASVSGRIKELRPAQMDEAYLTGTELFDALQCHTALNAQQAQLLLPARADTVALYKAVVAAPHGIRAGDLRPLFAKLAGVDAGKILVSLRALQELSLVTLDETGAAPCYRAVPQPVGAKKDLSAAPILQKLQSLEE